MILPWSENGQSGQQFRTSEQVSQHVPGKSNNVAIASSAERQKIRVMQMQQKQMVAVPSEWAAEYGPPYQRRWRSARDTSQPTLLPSGKAAQRKAASPMKGHPEGLPQFCSLSNRKRRMSWLWQLVTTSR